MDFPITERPSVYFALDEKANVVKIGKSRNITARIRALQTGRENPLKVIAAMPWDSMSILVPGTKDSDYHEKQLHKRFAKYRQHGEWFTYSYEIQVFLKILGEAGL